MVDIIAAFCILYPGILPKPITPNLNNVTLDLIHLWQRDMKNHLKQNSSLKPKSWH